MNPMAYGMMAARPSLGRPPRMRSACTECHKAKVRCTGEQTGCGRCSQNGFDCYYKQSMVGRNSRRSKKANRGTRTMSSDGVIARSTEDLTVRDDDIGVLDDMDSLTVNTAQPAGTVTTSIYDQLLLTDWSGSSLHPTAAILDWDGYTGTQAACSTDRAAVPSSSGGLGGAVRHRQRRQQQQQQLDDELDIDGIDPNFDSLYNHDDAILLSNSPTLEEPLITTPGPGDTLSGSLTYNSMCRNSPLASIMNTLPAPAVSRPDQATRPTPSRPHHHHTNHHQHPDHDPPSPPSLSDIENVDDGDIDQMDALSKIVHVLEAQQPSPSHKHQQPHRDIRLDELMRVVRTCTLATSAVVRRRQGFRWCASSKTMTLLILDLMLLLFEHMVQALAFSKETTTRSGQSQSQGDDHEDHQYHHNHRHDLEDQVCTPPPQPVDGLLPALQFGVLELEPAEQATVARRVVRRDLQRLLCMFQNLSGCCDGCMRDGRPKMLCAWYESIKSRLDHLVVVVKSSAGG